MSTFASRIKIWKTAFICISMYPLFGWGPQTYKKFYPLVHGHKAPHAHNIYIDSILSYGVIGTILVLCYTFVLNKEIFTSNTRKRKSSFIWYDDVLYRNRIDLWIVRLHTQYCCDRNFMFYYFK